MFPELNWGSQSPTNGMVNHLCLSLINNVPYFLYFRNIYHMSFKIIILLHIILFCSQDWIHSDGRQAQCLDFAVDHVAHSGARQ